MSKGNLAVAKEQNGAPKNTEKLIGGFVNELAKIEDEIEREMDKYIKPLQEAKKDLLKSAKDNTLNVEAIKGAVKYKRANNKQRRKIDQLHSDTEQYLHYVQIEMFKADETPAK